MRVKHRDWLKQFTFQHFRGLFYCPTKFQISICYAWEPQQFQNVTIFSIITYPTVTLKGKQGAGVHTKQKTNKKLKSSWNFGGNFGPCLHLKTQWYRRLFAFCSYGDDEDDHEKANIWIRNPEWIDLKTQRYQNRTIWKRIRVTRAHGARALSSINGFIFNTLKCIRETSIP